MDRKALIESLTSDVFTYVMHGSFSEEYVAEQLKFAGLDERFYVNYYDIPCPSVGPTGGRIHGADEYVDIDSLVEVAQTVALTTVDWCETA